MGKAAGTAHVALEDFGLALWRFGCVFDAAA